MKGLSSILSVFVRSSRSFMVTKIRGEKLLVLITIHLMPPLLFTRFYAVGETHLLEKFEVVVSVCRPPFC